MRVLVIEDEPTDLKLMALVLTLGGHSVCEKSSAEGAMETIAMESPDIILVDLRLPGIDGLTLVRQLKSDSSTYQIPIVAMTAFPHRYERGELLAAGCEAYIIKPINTRTLASQLMQVMETRLH